MSNLPEKLILVSKSFDHVLNYIKYILQLFNEFWSCFWKQMCM